MTRPSPSADQQLFRLICYMQSTKGLCIGSVVVDQASDGFMNVFVDAGPCASKST